MSVPPQLNRPLRVLHYIGANFGITGVETFALQLCAAQRRAGLTASIALDVEGRAELNGVANDCGVVMHALPARRGVELRLPRSLGGVLMHLRRVKMLVRLLRESDVLHIHEGMYALAAFLAARIAGVNATVVTHHASLTFHKGDWSWRRALTFWLEKRWTSRIVFPYRASAAEYLAAGVPEDRASVVPYCVDESRFEGITAEPGAGELTLVIAARMVPGKGHIELVGAVGRLAPHYPGLRLLIVGDGPTLPDVKAEVSRLGLGRSVIFRGRIDHRDMPELFRGAHVVALPSYMWGETFPLCLLEGMALGLPAIGARWYGIPDIIADGETGVLVEPRDVDTLAAAIERFLTDPAFYLRARRNALARFRARYTSTAVAAAYKKFYAAALLGAEAHLPPAPAKKNAPGRHEDLLSESAAAGRSFENMVGK